MPVLARHPRQHQRGAARALAYDSSSSPWVINRLDEGVRTLDISGGQGLVQFGELGLAFVLSALIGAEREWRQKAAGLRTHTLVGVGAALIVLVSKYGFTDVLTKGLIIVDPSRVAAQIVSGIGFLGAGLIIVRRDAIHGLTTAATIWLTAGIGMACGGGLAGLAAATTALYFIALYGFPALTRRLPRIGVGPATLRLTYQDGRGVLRRVLEFCTSEGFSVAEVTIDPEDHGPRPGVVDVVLTVFGRRPAALLAANLKDMEGVLSVSSADPNAVDD
jgi:putative Mg2+ transporter-C (MgtC) family protein